ncbi:MAG: ribosome maturation factor RimP [Mogibacterium sp.]|nr:ribosome maturation factor RimP [Mogibacterium sp.]
MAKQDISAEVSGLLQDYLKENNLELYKIEYKKEGAEWVLRVFPDKPEDSTTEYVSIDECEALNRYLSEKLDETNIIDRKYNLEVCSPGLDRELTKETDYIRFAGRQIEIKTYEQIDGSKQFEGVLLGKDEGIVRIKTESGEKQIPSEKISKINLAVVF